MTTRSHTVVRLTVNECATWIFNLTIAKLSTYTAGSFGVWVYNARSEPRKKTCIGVPIPNPYRLAGLPTRRGRFRFIPPKGSSPDNPVKAPQGGYLDKFGNAWQKGPNHHFPGEGAFEWDVPLANGGYYNVSQTGKVVKPAGQ